VGTKYGIPFDCPHVLDIGERCDISHKILLQSSYAYIDISSFDMDHLMIIY